MRRNIRTATQGAALVALLALSGPALALVEGSPNTGADQGLVSYSHVYIDVDQIDETLRFCSSDDGLVAGVPDAEFARQGEEFLLQRPSAARCQDDGPCRADEVCRDWETGLARAALPLDAPFSGTCVLPFSQQAGGFCDDTAGPGGWLEHVATETGAWRLDFAGEADQSTRNTRYWAVDVLDPDGVSVPLGRAHSTYWVLDAHDFNSNPTNANFYAVVPSGGEGAFVFVIDFEGMMGYVYTLFANAVGNVDTPARSWCQYGDPRPDRTCVDLNDADYQRDVHRRHTNRVEYQIYLSYPDGVTPPVVEPLIEDVQFNDEHGTATISPNGDGVQDVGVFTFTASVRGTYRIIVDTDGDGVFDGSRDLLLVGEAVAGPDNEHEWDGRGAPTGGRWPSGTTPCRRRWWSARPTSRCSTSSPTPRAPPSGQRSAPTSPCSPCRCSGMTRPSAAPPACPMALRCPDRRVGAYTSDTPGTTTGSLRWAT